MHILCIKVLNSCAVRPPGEIPPQKLRLLCIKVLIPVPAALRGKFLLKKRVYLEYLEYIQEYLEYIEEYIEYIQEYLEYIHEYLEYMQEYLEYIEEYSRIYTGNPRIYRGIFMRKST